jgi:hypothetical protein
MFTNFGHLPIYAMEQVLTTDGSELLAASGRKKSPMSSARIEASDRAEHHQRSLETCWRRCADSLGLRDFACPLRPLRGASAFSFQPGEPALCLGYCRGMRNRWGRLVRLRMSAPQWFSLI